MEWVQGYIWRQHEPVTDSDGMEPGFYFHDETSQLHGPFVSLEETREQLRRYTLWLLGNLVIAGIDDHEQQPPDKIAIDPYADLTQVLR